MRRSGALSRYHELLEADREDSSYKAERASVFFGVPVQDRKGLFLDGRSRHIYELGRFHNGIFYDGGVHCIARHNCKI